ncbi:DNA starvation/stationary phase protection protein [Streptomyces sp. A7024]|uniref:DNA starvation/stationary phase protection protein n=1 Tax=Streptomyces coryli TaxID=1128680 RepID=A0A6G4U291_9ACTN|nr:DNA starvation/stationary phase protection protein [Streptomyces coryli]
MESPLPEHERTVTGEALQGALVDLIELSLIAKQAHWNIIGPRFRSIHFQLDDVVATARSYADTVAERAAAIGVPPDGRATTVADTAGMVAPKEGWVQDYDAIELMTRCLADAASRMRARIDLTDKTDLVSQDVLLGLTAKLEKHYWMFQAEQQNQSL